MERWCPVPGFEKFLEASSLGNVRAIERQSFVRRAKRSYTATYKRRQYRPYVERNGYLVVSPVMNKKRKKLLVHRLIAFTFVEGHQEGYSVNHINNIKTDNRPENLEWITLAENTSKQWRDGLVNLKGENQPGHKLSAKQVIYIRRVLALGVPPHTLAIIAGVSPTLIYLIRDHVRWSALPDSETEITEYHACR